MPPLLLVLTTHVFPLSAADAKPAPPKKAQLPEAVKAELESGLNELAQEIQALKSELKDKPKLLDLLLDIQM